MNQRLALIVSSTMAAWTVSWICLSFFFLCFAEVKFMRGIVAELYVLAIFPAMLSAAASSGLVSGSKRFEHRSDLANAIRVCLLAYPIFFGVLWAVIWGWLQFERYLPMHERPENPVRMAETAANYTAIALIAGVLPAIFFEYFVVRFIRKRWSPARPSGAVA